MVDRQPSRNLRLEVAFETEPDAEQPSWVDLTSRLDLRAGITNRRGREDEFSQVQTGTMACTLDNKDGALTPDLASGAYYPNVLPQRRIRLTYRDPANYGAGNLLSAENASFEGGTTGDWLNNYLGAPAASTISNSATHPSHGTKGLLATWPTAAAGCGTGLIIEGLAKGRRYSARCVVWIPGGSPAVRFGDPFGQTSTTTSSVTGAFQTLTITWTATSYSIFLALVTTTGSTAGQQCWVDAVMVDETPVGSSLGTFTTTAPDINHRFDGHVDEWPVSWPGASGNFADAQITATDMLARIGVRQERGLRSVVSETMMLAEPVACYPLSEPEGSTAVADITGGMSILSQHQVGTGGSITFGGSTGVPTDGAAAPLFSPVDWANGVILKGSAPSIPYSFGLTLVAAVRVASAPAVGVVAASIADNWGNRLSVGFDTATGKARALYDTNTGNTQVLSAANYADNATHLLAVTASQSGGTTTIRLVVDGVAVTSATTSSPLAWFANVTIGGEPQYRVLDGTISHVAVYASVLSDAQLLEIRDAQTTGFANERTDERIARIASWCGIPTSRLQLDVGNSQVSHVDCTGLNPLEYMRKVEATEAGLLLAGADGALVFLNRARSYDASVTATTVPSRMLGGDTRLVQNLAHVRNDVTGTRPGGPSQRAYDQDSIDNYGTLSESVELLAIDDSNLLSAVQWRLQQAKDPAVRVAALTLDAFTDPTYSPAILADVEIGTRVAVTDMPTQAPASSLDQSVQGYTETITESSWTLAVNGRPFLALVALIADDPTDVTKADGPGVAVY